jgi:hypothetical protein
VASNAQSGYPQQGSGSCSLLLWLSGSLMSNWYLS